MNTLNYIYKQHQIKYFYETIHPKLEIIRYKFLFNIFNIFFKICNKYNKHIIKPKTNDIIIRFIWKNITDIDPVIPYKKNNSYDYKQLIIDLENFGCDPIKVLHELNIEQTLSKFIKKYNKFYNEYDFQKEYFIQNDEINKLLLYKKYHVKYNDKILTKLNYHFKNLNNTIQNKLGIIFCLLYRYSYLDADSQQLAIDLNFKQDLKNTFNVDIEMFGSGINRFFKNYCSLFYDIEQYFGSIGNFFTIQPIQGLYMCNPPYDEDLMEQMAINIVKHLNNTDKPLGFIITVPIWDKTMRIKISNICKSKITRFIHYKCKEVFVKSKYLYKEYVFCANNFPYYSFILDKIIYASPTYIFIVKNNLIQIDLNIFNSLLLKNNLKFINF